jgi:hypothetical protein
MKTCGIVDVQICVFMTSALVGGERPASRLGRFSAGERASSTRRRGGWVGPRNGLDYLERRKFLNQPGFEFRLISCPIRSQSVYRLRYPGSVGIRRGADKSLAFPISPFPISSKTKRIFLGWVKEVRTTKS